MREHADAEVVLVRLSAPLVPPTGVDGYLATRDATDQFHHKLGRAVRRFRGLCPELTDRSKRKKRECTNVC